MCVFCLVLFFNVGKIYNLKLRLSAKNKFKKGQF